MTTKAMRAQLVAYLAEADDKKIAGLYSLLEDSINEKKSMQFTQEQIDFLQHERTLHITGQTESYAWEEVKDMIRKKKAS